MQRVLVRLAELCGDARGIRFGPADLAPAAPLPTTLDELEQAGLVELVAFLKLPNPYRLTLEGWFEAQRAAGHFESNAFNDRRARICAEMKRKVAGRCNETPRRCDELAEASGVPEGWLWNMLEAQVLYRLDPKGRYLLRFEDGAVYVPPTFGQEPVDLD